jgi:hypothetical protein
MPLGFPRGSAVCGGHPFETGFDLVAAFRDRLKKVAGFQYVPDPLPMKNSNNVVVYYLFLASQKAVAEKIIRDIFTKYR